MATFLEVTVLALGIAYVAFDLYFFAATFSWLRQLRRVNRDALLLSGFRGILDFVYQGPVAEFVDRFAEPAVGAEHADRLVREAYPQLAEQLGAAQRSFELPLRLHQLEEEARFLQRLAGALTVGMTLLLVLSASYTYGFGALVIGVIVNSVLMLLFSTARAEVGLTLRRAGQILERLHATHPRAGDSEAPSAEGRPEESRDPRTNRRGQNEGPEGTI